MVAVVLTPVNSAGQPIYFNPLNGLPAPVNSSTATMTFAVVGPMSGPDAMIGQQMVNGARAAIDDANARPTGSLDRTFVLVTFDDQDQPIQSALSASYAINDGNVVGVVGHFTGVNTNAALHTYVAAQMPLVVPATTSDVVTSHGYRNVFRLPTRDSVEGSLTARYLLRTSHPKHCVIITSDGAYGSDVAQAFAQEMRGAHVDVSNVGFTEHDVSPESVAERALTADPDLVYFAGKISDLGNVFNVIAASRRKIAFAASQGFFSGLTTKDYPQAAEGMLVATSIPPMALVPFDKLIVSNFAARYGSFTPVAGFAYAAMQVLIAAARRAGAISRPSLTRALSDGSTYQTIAGDFSFLPFGDQVDPNLFFYTVLKGAWSYLASYRPAPFAINKES